MGCYIRQLPHTLVEAFKSTLEEVAQADLLLHVVDAHHPERIDLMQQVDTVLEEIGALSIPTIRIFNKIDLSGESPHQERDGKGRTGKIWLSAKTGDGTELLLKAISEHYRQHRTFFRLHLPVTAGRLRARIYDRVEIINEHEDSRGGWIIEVTFDSRDSDWLKRQTGYDESMITQTLAPLAS